MKKDITTPNPPTERPAGPKTMPIDLSADTAARLRKLSTRTGLTQAQLRDELSRSREVDTAVVKARHRIYLDWKEGLVDDLFGPPEKGAPDA